MLLDVILETHAWAAARPKYESQMTVQKLEQKMGDIVEVEKEQGTSSPAARPTIVSCSSSSSVSAYHTLWYASFGYWTFYTREPPKRIRDAYEDRFGCIDWVLT
ncbi:hypothetical protein K435DRAFT_867181 [Dendrothele bispora CBS 962.96]|uniref:Uncharacterized protein n=1 Tax=Dendrothele bispora (strain CBS 962.96) TaxID=1314807 RepID=A0A4S8LF51_DENBC|nr:hypothetical protein K435DRAFT_867181 [Dendrothele bispora CBS 962.96]